MEIEVIHLLVWFGIALVFLLGLAGLVIPILPGPPLLFLAFLLAAWAENFNHIGTNTLIILGLLAIFAVMLDFVAGALGAKRYGASKPAILGSIIGASLGIFVSGPIGLFIGPFLGAVLGELLYGNHLKQAGKSGIGATIGMLIGMIAKLVVGLLMVALFLTVRFMA